MSQRRSWLTGAGLALALACTATLTGCLGPGDPPAGTLSAPSGSPTGTTTPTGLPATASPGATGTGGTAGTPSVDPSAYQPATSTSPAKNVPKPVMPEAAKKKDLEGQKAFIQYWIATYNYMRESGDTAPFLAACEKTSKFCTGSVKNLEGLQGKGIWRLGGKVRIAEIRPETSNDAERLETLTAAATEAISAYYDADGIASGVAVRSTEATYDTVIVIKWSDRWSVREFGGDPS